MLSRGVVVSFALVLAACSSETGSDAGSGVDASRHDAGASDAGARDAGSSRDSGASDAGAVADASTDASTDAGLDCSVIGCGAPIVCGETCAEPCGCCDCAEGEETTRGDTTYVCAGGCYAPRGTLGDGELCTSTSECAEGSSCCYPCGIPGCMNQCVPTCTGPGCAGGCPLVP